MKLTITSYNAVAAWKWDTSTEPHRLYHYSSGANDAYEDEDDEDEDDVCGICRLAFESCCPACKVPGDDCPLIWGECSHVFHMHCLLKWIETESSKQQCPLDRRPWETADRKPDKLPTTVDGAPVASVAPGPIGQLDPHEAEEDLDDSREEGDVSTAEEHEGMEVDEDRR